jgi:glycosyltransferase involved in cell wall biosynthesis
MPGVDQKIFKPMPKAQARAMLGIKDNVNIVLTVMRNQPRKLFPDLMYAFRKTLNEWKAGGHHALAKDTYLYLHTSYPDVGFDIGKDIVKYKLSSKVLMTYCCNHCGAYFASFFNGEVCTCNNCGNFTAHPPNTAMGLTREQLSVVYNTADLYVQLSVAGALEIPLIEAKACAVPTIATDYAAMHEINSLGGSYGGIKIAAWREESDKETAQIRALPDPNDCADKMKAYFLETAEFREKLSLEALSTVRNNHSNEETYRKWDSIFEKMPMLPNTRWYTQPKYIDTSKINTSAMYNDEDFIDYLVFNFTPPKCSFRSYAARKELSTMLKTKIKGDEHGNRRIDRSDIVNIVINAANQYNGFENFRFSTMNNIKPTEKLVEVV